MLRQVTANVPRESHSVDRRRRFRQASGRGGRNALRVKLGRGRPLGFGLASGRGESNGLRMKLGWAAERKRRGKLAVVLLCLLSLLAVGCLRADMSVVVDDSDVSVNLRMTADPRISSLLGEEFWDGVLDSSELMNADGLSSARVEAVSDPDGWTGVSVELEGPTSEILTDVINRSSTEEPQLKRTDTGWHFYWQTDVSQDMMGSDMMGMGIDDGVMGSGVMGMDDMMGMGDSFGDFDSFSSGEDPFGKDLFGKDPGLYHKKGDLPWKSFESPRKDFDVPGKGWDCDCPEKGFADPWEGFNFFQKDGFNKKDYESFEKEFDESFQKEFDESFLKEFDESFLKEFDSRFEDFFSGAEDAPSSWEDFASFWEDFASSANSSEYFKDDSEFPRNGDDYSWSDDAGGDLWGDNLPWEDSDSFWEDFAEEFASDLGESGLSVESFGFLQDGADLSWEDLLPLLDEIAPLLEGFDSSEDSEASSGESRNDTAWRDAGFSDDASETSRVSRTSLKEPVLAMEGEDSHMDSGDDSGIFDMNGWDFDGWGFDSEDFEFNFSVTLPGELVDTNSEDVTSSNGSTTARWSYGFDDSNYVFELVTTTEGSQSSGGLGLAWILTIIFGALLHIVLIAFVLTRNRYRKAMSEGDSPSPDDDSPDSPSDDSPPSDDASGASPPDGDAVVADASDDATLASDDSSSEADAGDVASDDAAEDSNDTPPASGDAPSDDSPSASGDTSTDVADDAGDVASDGSSAEAAAGGDAAEDSSDTPPDDSAATDASAGGSSAASDDTSPDDAPPVSDDSSADSDAGGDAAEDSGNTPPALENSLAKQDKTSRRFGSFRRRSGRSIKP